MEIPTRHDTVFPFPKGHGQGEGERNSILLMTHTWQSLRKTIPLRYSATATLVTLFTVALLATGCGGGKAQKQSTDFFTSGSRDADQRASQRMAQAEQLNGSGEGAGEKDVKKAIAPTNTNNVAAAGTNQAARAVGKLSLYERLGAEAGISNIVVDFIPRAMQDPRVNWDRKGETVGGLSIHHSKSVAWDASPQNVALLQNHMVQFLTLATGGPAHYEGKEIKQTHADMHISNAEFDATLGDLKASLDKLQVPNTEQKELLAIVESTRPLIVTDR
ncbi:MAG TPA: group 1 truncated hemoglobin [Verrucomicrobiae bacterium]|nr:group 1 truncated hemoglobin [Verrucomicrobiae bacterium]